MTDNASMKRVAEKLRRAGANLPAPELSGTIEGSVITGLCIALVLVESEIEALSQTEQEPCGWQFYQDGKWHNGMETNNHRANTERSGIPVRDVYPAPQRKPLTDEQIFALENSIPDEIVSDRDWCIHFARAIEAKLKEKNNG